MTTKMHTDIAFAALATSAVLNAPLGQLDSALADLEAVLGDWVAAGGLPGASASLTLAQPATRAFVLNTYVTVAAQNLVMVASKDNYVDLDTVGAYHVTAVTLGAAAPAIFANSLRLYKAVAGAIAVSAVVDLRPSGSFGSIAVPAIGAFRQLNASFSSVSTASGAPGGSGLTHAPFGLEYGDNVFFVDTYDPAMYFGYNMASGGTKKVAGEPYLGYVAEADYNDGIAHRMEIYPEFKSIDGAITIRPWAYQFDRSISGAGNINAAMSYSLIAGNPLTVTLPDGTVLARFPSVSAAQMAFFPGTVLAGDTVLSINAKTGLNPHLQLNINDVTIAQLLTGSPTQASLLIVGATAMTWYKKAGAGGTSVAINVADNNAGLTVLGGIASGFNGAQSIVGRASASQTGNIFEAQDSGSAPHFVVTPAGLPKISAAADEATAAGTALLGSNSPATTLAAPYKWFKFVSSDGTTCYVPAWK